MNRSRSEQDPRMLNIYESIATAIYSHHSRQSLDEAQMEFLLSLLDGVYYQRLDEEFLGALRSVLETDLSTENRAELHEVIIRTDLQDEASVKAHCRILRHWLDENAASET